MVAFMSNTFMFYKTKPGKRLKFEPPMHTITSTATYLGSNKRAPSLSIQITDHKKKKYFLYNPIESSDSYINMLNSYYVCITKRGI